MLASLKKNKTINMCVFVCVSIRSLLSLADSFFSFVLVTSPAGDRTAQARNVFKMLRT